MKGFMKNFKKGFMKEFKEIPKKKLVYGVVTIVVVSGVSITALTSVHNGGTLKGIFTNTEETESKENVNKEPTEGAESNLQSTTVTETETETETKKDDTSSSTATNTTADNKEKNNTSKVSTNSNSNKSGNATSSTKKSNSNVSINNPNINTGTTSASKDSTPIIVSPSKNMPSGEDNSLEIYLISSPVMSTPADSYQNSNGEKVSVFDNYFNKLVEGSISSIQVENSIRPMTWREHNHLSLDENDMWNYAVLKVCAVKFTTAKITQSDISNELLKCMDTGGEYSKVNAYWDNNTKKYTISAITIGLE